MPCKFILDHLEQGILHVVLNPKIENVSRLIAELTIKNLLNREVQNGGFNVERVTGAARPINCVRLYLGSWYQFQSTRLCGQGPDSKTWARVINQHPRFSFLHDAEKDRQWMLNDPPH